MVKGKIVSKGVKAGKKALKDAGAGTKAVAAATAVDAITDAPAAQAAIGAVEGAALGAAVGGVPGAVAGGLIGGVAGFILADGERVVPIDMIAIPAYQYSMVMQGKEPTFQIFIKEGELITPVKPTDFMQSSQIVDAVSDLVEKPKRQLSSWQKYLKNKKNHVKFKSGKNKGKLNLKAMSKAFKRGRK